MNQENTIATYARDLSVLNYPEIVTISSQSYGSNVELLRSDFRCINIGCVAFNQLFYANGGAAKRFLSKMLKASDTQALRVINEDKNAAYPPVIDQLKADEQLPETTELRLVLYLNRVELSAPKHLRD